MCESSQDYIVQQGRWMRQYWAGLRPGHIRPDILSLRALRFLTNGAGAKHAWLEFRDACSWGKSVTFTTSPATHS